VIIRFAPALGIFAAITNPVSAQFPTGFSEKAVAPKASFNEVRFRMAGGAKRGGAAELIVRGMQGSVRFQRTARNEAGNLEVGGLGGLTAGLYSAEIRIPDAGIPASDNAKLQVLP
jgi:hypothetical protein